MQQWTIDDLIGHRTSLPVSGSSSPIRPGPPA